MSSTRIGIVIPCFNEEETLDQTAETVGEQLRDLIDAEEIEVGSFVCFVDDGSRDGTWKKIEEWTSKGTLYRGVKLSRNVGHQRALLAGLMSMRDEAEALVSMDADLQDPAHTIPLFVNAYLDGNEVVYGVREDRSSDSGFKRGTAEFFYRLMRKLGVDIVPNHADCRLLGPRALDALSLFDEANLFLRGIVPLIGYPSTRIYYKRDARLAGETKYPLRKMLAFAWDGVTSFSTKPLGFIMWLGFFVCLASFAVGGWVAYTWVEGQAIPGWTSMLLPLLFIGGVQLLCTGVIGQYLGKIYQEVKHRPRYFIEKRI
ncbi:MAG: glycosyltransferase [Bdellovibrionales bacterium]|nr:glycosyltransferase [Bdellovibrionales bacterium]